MQQRGLCAGDRAKQREKERETGDGDGDTGRLFFSLI